MIPPTYSNKERLVTKRLVQSVYKLVYSPYPILNVYYLEKYYIKSTIWGHINSKTKLLYNYCLSSLSLS